MTNLFDLKQMKRCILAGAITLLFVAGCATKVPEKKKTYTFFPPPPDEPRVQFLMEFSSDSDVGVRSRFAEFVTGKAAAKKPIVKPYGLALKDGKLFVCDTMISAIEVFDFSKKTMRYFSPGGEGHLHTPINITLDADDTRYIADAAAGKVFIYDKKEDFVASIGKKDEMRPCDVMVTADRLYVADVKNHVVHVYSKADRKELFTIPRNLNATEGKLFSPTNLSPGPNGELFVSDTGAYAIRVYDLEGKYLRSIGQMGAAPGLFARPKGVAVDRQGLVYVVDAATQLCQVFDKGGKLLMFFGQAGASTYGELALPAAVKIDYDNIDIFKDKVAPGFKPEYLILVTSQSGKVSVYAFVKKI